MFSTLHVTTLICSHQLIGGCMRGTPLILSRLLESIILSDKFDLTMRRFMHTHNLTFVPTKLHPVEQEIIVIIIEPLHNCKYKWKPDILCHLTGCTRNASHCMHVLPILHHSHET